jgi:hypothetical protein
MAHALEVLRDSHRLIAIGDLQMGVIVVAADFKGLR